MKPAGARLRPLCVNGCDASLVDEALEINAMIHMSAGASLAQEVFEFVDFCVSLPISFFREYLLESREIKPAY